MDAIASTTVGRDGLDAVARAAGGGIMRVVRHFCFCGEGKPSTLLFLLPSSDLRDLKIAVVPDSSVALVSCQRSTSSSSSLSLLLAPDLLLEESG